MRASLPLRDLRPIIERAWDIETTYTPERYAGADPATGQCAVTAVLVQQLLGGYLLMGTAVPPDAGPVRPHYWTEIDGLDIDLTMRQFPIATELRDVQQVPRQRVVADVWMAQRYATLSARVAAALRARDAL